MLLITEKKNTKIVLSCNTIKTTAKLDLSNTKWQGSSLFIKLKMTHKNKT